MATIFYQPVFPLSTLPRILDIVIDDNIDALVLGAFGTGSTPSSILPQIERATKKKIPVFSIRQTTVDQWYTEWSDYKEQLLPGAYQVEVNAIALGLIPLQKDLVRLNEVLEGVQEICESTHDYNQKISLATKRYSSPEWNERLNHIRLEADLPAIEYGLTGKQAFL
ncbi:MAG: hypothetical protein ISS25_03370 [Nanoarchaeota archaeon]|nr:hypothetical protein [DPANN group archaeon]MBL7116841.1 hypothetical protein [Nanoarchaeota archaeon]